MKKILFLILIAMSLFLVKTVQAQVGSGWTQQTFSERFEYESNDVLFTISPPPASFNNGYCEYGNTGGVETFQLLSSHSNRAEIRPNDDYSSGTRQFQANVLISSPSVDECIHQIFNGTVSPYLLLREETNYNGSLKVAINGGGGASNLATNLYGVWFQLNSINDLNNGNTYLYVNGSLVWSGANPGGTFYTKYGCYGSHTISAEIQFTNVILFSGGNEVRQDFSLAASPASQSVLPGGGTSYTVTDTFTNTVNNAVFFSVSGLPAGATASFSPVSVVGTGSSTLNVTTSGSTLTGSYTLTITGATRNSSDITHTKTVTLNVTDFSVSATPSSQGVVSGGTSTNTATVSAVNGFAGTVVWSVSGLPSGASGNFSPASVAGSGSSTLLVTLTNTTPTGTYPLTVTGTDGSVQHSTSVSLVVSDFTISATPSSQTVTAGSNTTYTVNAGNNNGFTGTISLGASGLPAGAVGNFSPATIGAPGASTLTVTTSGSMPASTNTLTITGTSGNLAHGATVTLKVTAAGGSLPAGWTDTDIGAVGLPGSASYSGGVYTVNGSGADIWGTNDEFNYAWQLATNDFTITARTASIVSSNVWSKSGVMVRGNNTTNSTYVALYVTTGSGVSMQCRTATGASAVDLVIQTNAVAPYWVRLVRSGSTFTGFSSPDGTNWTQVAATNVTMAAGVEAGLSVCAHDSTQLNTSTFDNVSVLPVALTDTDIGSPGLAGSGSYSGGVYTVKGSGADIYGTNDQFNYYHQGDSNNAAITARVATLQSTNVWSKSGVMIRETTAANSVYVGIYVTTTNGVDMQYRSSTGASAVDLARVTGVTAPYWVQLVRSGNTFTGYSSADGVAWTQVGSVSVTMAASDTAGLAVCSHDNTKLNTTTFDHVSIH